MNYCLSAYLSHTYLKKANEIKFPYKDRKGIYNAIEKYPNASFYLICSNEKNIDWEILTQYNILCKNNFVISVDNLKDFYKAKELDIKVFFDQEIISFFQLNALIKLGVDAVRLGAPLFFNMDKVKNLLENISIRAVANIAYRDFILRENGIHGTWIRPEDVDYYEPYIDIIEFEKCETIEKEEALYRIYAEQKQWMGPLNLIIENFNYECDNFLISSDFTSARLNCRQRCEENGGCKICDRMLFLANNERIKQYKKAIN